MPSRGKASGILRTHGIVITDAQGHDNILIGTSAIATAKSTSSYGRTNSIVFLNPAGGYHLALGQTPEPVVNGKAIGTRIGNGDNYGVTLYDTLPTAGTFAAIYDWMQRLPLALLLVATLRGLHASYRLWMAITGLPQSFRSGGEMTAPTFDASSARDAR